MIRINTIIAGAISTTAVALWGIATAVGTTAATVTPASVTPASVTPASVTSAGVSRAEAEAYFDDLAVELAQPGLWVDPEVSDEFTSSDLGDIADAIAQAPVPMRIAVIPADRLNVSTNEYSVDLAWPDADIPSQLYDRVGVDGVYAVLVDAASSYEGRGFHAVQHGEDGPTYYVEDAIDRAVECCAPDYDDMVMQFVERASQVDDPLYIDAAPWVGGGAAVAGVWWAGNAWSARRKRRSDQQWHVTTLRPVLTEEIIDLSTRVSAEGAANVGTTGATAVLDLVEKARQRLDAAQTDADIVAVGTLLDDARYRLACLEAERDGRPAPERAVPCFFDPRHGPSSSARQWAPSGGAEREVPTCDECAARLDANQVPDTRMIGDDPYWDAGESSIPYVEGYWRDSIHRFPDSNLRSRRTTMHSRWHQDRPRQRFGRAMGSLGRGLSELSSSSGSDGSGRSGWGGSSRRSRSSRTRSFGGGSSRRSSSRSSGSRRF